MRAGDRARDQLAHDEAVSWYRQALEVGDGEATAERLDLLLSLGEVERRAGLDSARGSLLQAAALARDLGAGDKLVAAALANTRPFTGRAAPLDADRVAVLRDAAAADAGSPAERARVKALLASELVWADGADDRFGIADEALASARELDDQRVLAGVLQLRIPTIAAPDTVEERIELTEELYALAGELDDPCLLYTSPSPRDGLLSRMPSSA